MIARLAIVVGLLEQFCHPCGPDTDIWQTVCEANKDADMAGPTGPEPFIQWVTPRVPIGAPTIEVRGLQFGTETERLKVEFAGAGPVPTAKIVTLQDTGSGMVLVAQLTWPTGSMSGPAKIVVTKNDTGPSKGNQMVLLVRPAFEPAGTRTLTAAANSVYLGDGPTANQRTLFAVTTTPELVSIPYDGMNGSFMPAMSLASVVAAGPAKLELPRPTEFVALNASQELVSCTFVGAVYSCGGATAYTKLWGTPAAVSSGSTDKMRELIAVAADSNSLYRCFYDHNQATKAQPCAKIPGYGDNAKKVWVGQLGAAGRADIIALSAAGTLTLWRDDGTGTDTFVDRTSVLPQAAGTTWQAVVVDEVDSLLGKDVVAVGPSGIITWLNKGDGTFAAPKTDHAQLVAAKDVLLGDIDGDTRPDLLLLPPTGDGLQVLLNLFDASNGSGRFSAPAMALDDRSSQPITGVTGSLLTADDGAAGARRRLIIVNSTTVTAWDNKVKP